MRIVVPSVLAMLTFAVIVAADVLAAALAAAVVWLVAYALTNAPARHRRHGVERIRQAVDHNFGLFGGTYRDESTSAVVTPSGATRRVHAAAARSTSAAAARGPDPLVDRRAPDVHG
jgi:hypothetical protein